MELGRCGLCSRCDRDAWRGLHRWRIVRWLRSRLFSAQSHRFRDSLAFLLLRGLPGAKRRSRLRHLIQVVLDAAGVMRSYALHFRLNLGVFPNVMCFEFFKLFLLASFIRAKGVLAARCILQYFVNRGAGGVEGHKH
jgi:hypothetical protein